MDHPGENQAVGYLMKWEKKGLIIKPDTERWWMQSHCQLPTVLPLGGDLFRIYFASRDKRQYSHVGYAEIDINYPDKVLYAASEPVLYPGEIGFFDEHGVYPSSIIPVGDELFLYYIGWNKGCEEPLFYASIGLAISKNYGRTFEKHSPAPIFSRNKYAPTLVTAPFVFLTGKKYSMIYTGGLRWERDLSGNLRSLYHLKYSESSDGIVWSEESTVAIDFASEAEKNISRAVVLKDGEIYRAWYAFHTVFHPYRIGYAESPDGKKWIRRDDFAGITVSPSGFDSEMICYPYVIQHNGNLYMFYNGNRFGKDGIGLAIAQNEY